MLVEAYIGWFTWPEEIQAEQMLKYNRLNRVFLASYRESPELDNDVISNLQLIGNAGLNLNKEVDVRIIFSAEFHPTEEWNDECCWFMGCWLTENTIFEAENLFRDQYPSNQESWMKGINLEGFQYFAYSHLKEPRCDEDRDGLSNELENESDCLKVSDKDTDDDGIVDGAEDSNKDGVVDPGETNPCNSDTDADGIQDGTEIGLTMADIGPGTDTGIFIPDADPNMTTDPLDSDSDNDGLIDGEEDINGNGRIDEGESDPRTVKALSFISLLLLNE